MTNKKNEPDGNINTDLVNSALNSLLKPYQATPPAPRVLSQMPAGMLGYEERKQAERAQADKDREVTKQAAAPETKRLAFIGAVKRAFPYIDVEWIATQVDPWDMFTFKERIAQAQRSFLKEQERH